MDPTDDALLVSHSHLNRIIGDVVRLLDDGYSEELARRWSQLEEQVVKHMREEEATILVAYESHDPEDAAFLKADHLRMRDLFEAGSKAMAMKRVHVGAIRNALTLYRTHQLREETGLYRWSREQRRGS